MQTTEELERIRAVSRYLSGESPKAICQSTGRPKKWLYKWVARSRSGDADWFADDSRAPRHSPSKTAPEINAQIVTARQSLERTPYASRGVFSIRQNLSDDGITDVPSDATINRIISSAGLVSGRVPRVKVERTRFFGGPWLGLQILGKLELVEFLESVLSVNSSLKPP